jgi:hypothetical protein
MYLLPLLFLHMFSFKPNGNGNDDKIQKPLEVLIQTRARICRPFKEPRNRFPAWRAGTTTLFDEPAC